MSPCWPRAGSSGVPSAQLKSSAADFEVSENLAFEPTGEGEHLYLRLQKINLTSLDVAKRLARIHGVAVNDVGLAGMKDKRAVSDQWFSVPVADGPAPDLSFCDADRSLAILQVSRHPKKLRRGQLSGNSFTIRLREPGQGDHALSLQTVAAQGAPNYFGPQRFGQDNLQQATDWLKVRRSRRISAFHRGLYLSVLRSYLFNEVLAARVIDGSWQQPIAGDIVEEDRPTGPLWGRGRSAVTLAAAELENRVLEPYAEICDGLEHAGVQQQRRSLVLVPAELSWQIEADDNLLISFTLPAGGYATTLLGQVFDLTVLERDE